MAALEKSVRAAKKSRGEEIGEATGTEPGEPAEVTPLPSRRSARTAPKEVGGKKSTSTAKKTAAKKTAAKSTAKSTDHAAGKAGAATKSTAKKTAAKKTSAKKATAKKTAAKKATARGRASA